MTVTHFVVSVHQYGGGDLIWNGVQGIEINHNTKGSSEKKEPDSSEG